MLETLNPDKKIDKATYREWFPRLKADLRELQQPTREVNLPVVVILEGYPLAGKGDTIRHIGEALDPRGFMVHSAKNRSLDDDLRHWLWRYWIRLPNRGRFAFFEKSWYSRVLSDRIYGRIPSSHYAHAYQQINQTEQMLAADGALIVKLWLHIGPKELRDRLQKARRDPFWQHTTSKEDRDGVRRYEDYAQAAEEMLERTSTSEAPWHIVESNDKRYRRLKIFQLIIEQVTRGINERRKVLARKPAQKSSAVHIPAGLDQLPTLLDRVPLQNRLSQEKYDDLKVSLQVTLRKLQYSTLAAKVPWLIVFEGWDAAGKGGTIRRLTNNLDPHYYDVIPIAKPTPEELSHHYLWRFWRAIPKNGWMTIFDRSWYGRVLVERVEGFATEEEWQRAYREINEFEHQLHTGGYTIIKFWLHISQDEQLRRFKAREADNLKKWKLTDEDWRNREKFQPYNSAVEEMVERTSTSHAPWHLIAADCKRYARVQCMETVIRTLEERLAAETGKSRKRTEVITDTAGAPSSRLG